MKQIFCILICLIAPLGALANSFSISGYVTNINNQAISETVVFNSDSSISAKTDKNGYFQMFFKDSSDHLIISAAKHRSARIAVQPYLNEHYHIILREGQDYVPNDKEHYFHSKRPDAELKEFATLDVLSRASAEGGDGIDMGGFAASIMIEHPTIGSVAVRDQGSAGVLTAGEVNDFSKWQLWKDISDNDLAMYVEKWNFSPLERFTVQLESNDKSPIVNAKIKLLQDGKLIWQSRTDNTGKAELWANAFEQNKQSQFNYSIEAEYDGQTKYLQQATKFHDGINFLRFDNNCSFPNKLDIAFVVDATGSMGDEINYLKAELTDIIQKVKDSVSHLDIMVSSLFYRDYTDQILTKHKDFTANIDEMVAFIQTNHASGGGDFPEAVDAALNVATNQLSWRDDALAKIIFLVLDAPPHQTEASIESLKESIKKASQMGIRIVPLTCSGIDKSTEYIMRSFALLTNGTYLFLTDDSGIGSGHIEPTTDNYAVKLLNSLLFRTIYQMTYLPECNAEIIATADTLIVQNPDSVKTAVTGIIPSNENKFGSDDPFAKDDDIFAWKYYPNPCTGVLKIEVKGKIEELFITDITGKVIYRIANTNDTFFEVNLTAYPNGVYFIRYEYEPNKWASGKFLISR